VFSHVIRGRPGGLFQFSGGRAVFTGTGFTCYWLSRASVNGVKLLPSGDRKDIQPLTKLIIPLIARGSLEEQMEEDRRKKDH